MKNSKTPLQPGDRARVYDATKFNWPVNGIVVEVSPALIIKGQWGEGKFFPQQVRRLKSRAPKVEREPIIQDMYAYRSALPFSEGDWTHTIRVFRTRAQCQRELKCGFNSTTRLQEVPPGSVVVTREKLVKAWNAATEKTNGLSILFQDVANALGLEAEARLASLLEGKSDE